MSSRETPVSPRLPSVLVLLRGISAQSPPVTVRFHLGSKVRGPRLALSSKYQAVAPGRPTSHGCTLVSVSNAADPALKPAE